jgi:N-acetylglutamate synthase-like GNAT family acetyltransferase
MAESRLIRGQPPLSSAVALLQAQGLHASDISDEHLENFFYMGSGLTGHAEKYGASRNVPSIYLLTTTAESFFKRLDYERIDRSQAPRSIERTREFASLCPATSAFIVKSL